MALHQTKKFLHKPRKLSTIQERLLNEWEKIFANATPDKGISLSSKIYKELLQLKIKQINNPITKQRT